MPTLTSATALAGTDHALAFRELALLLEAAPHAPTEPAADAVNCRQARISAAQIRFARLGLSRRAIDMACRRDHASIEGHLFLNATREILAAHAYALADRVAKHGRQLRETLATLEALDDVGEAARTSEAHAETRD